jgi:hypothetical protein
MRLATMLPALLGALLVGGCNSLGVGDLNDPGVENLQNSPTRVGVLTLATGLQVGSRYQMSAQNGYTALLGIMGREVYNLDPADPRFVSEMVVGPLDGGSPAFGGNLFQLFYANLRTSNILMRAMAGLSDDPQAGMSPAEKEATTGYVQTLQAYDFLRIINTRDDLGAPVDVDIDPTGPPAPIKTKAEVFTHITNLLDSAVAHLAAGGTTFPFALSEGYTGFGTPATFIKFNRALRARVAAYQADYTTAKRLLEDFPDSTFLDVAGPLATGVYHSYSTASGDVTNALFDPTARAIVVHTALRTDAQTQVGGAPDKRFTDKTIALGTPKSTQLITSDLANNVYTDPSSPVPIIRNEELILLRAEERIFNSNFIGAKADLDVVRATAGNLPPYPGLLDQGSLLADLLYNRRYSLLLEGGHRWIDLRRFNLLNTIPQENTQSGLGRRFSRFPFPTNECLSRNPAPAQGCSPEAGF